VLHLHTWIQVTAMRERNWESKPLWVVANAMCL